MSLSTSSLALRASGAIVLTGVAATLIGSAFIAIVMTLAAPQDASHSVAEWFALIGMIAFIGAFVSMPSALLIGLVCELPKTLVLAKRRDADTRTLIVHMAFSLAVGLLLGLGFLVLFGGSPELIDTEAWVLVLLLFGLGGLVSGAVWWKLVTKPAILARTA